MKNIPEIMKKAAQAGSVEELLTLAEENEILLTAEQAHTYFDKLHSKGELSDDELGNVAGGGCGDNGDNGDVCIIGVDESANGKRRRPCAGLCSKCGATLLKINYAGGSSTYVCPRCSGTLL